MADEQHRDPSTRQPGSDTGTEPGSHASSDPGEPGHRPGNRADARSEGAAHRDTGSPGTPEGASTDATVVHEDRREVVGREREEYGGVKVGAAFFGWLTAAGMTVLLLALATALGTALGVATGNDSPGEAADAVGVEADTIGLAGGIVLLVVLLVASYCGGYVAGRMSRFDGVKQGVAVWLWGIVVAVVVAVLVWVAGDDVVGDADGIPQITVGAGDVTTGGLIALAAVLVVTLVGAVLGGLAGMRFHRRVDRAGLGR